MANRIIGVTLILASLLALAGCVNLGRLVGGELEAVLVPSLTWKVSSGRAWRRGSSGGAPASPT